MQNEALEFAKDGMDKAMEHLHTNLAKIRAGRANPAVFDGLKVESYGTVLPLNQVATISVGDARLLVIKPWDRNMLGPIEKAINNSSLGFNPNSDGVILRIPVPPLTEERRRGLVKQVRDFVEETKIACRQARREANELLKESEKDKQISEDELKRGLEKIQQLTDEYIKKTEEALLKKEAEIMEV